MEEHILMVAVLAKCGLRTITFEKFPFWPNYFDGTIGQGVMFTPACARLQRILATPETYAHVTKLNLSRMDTLSFPGHEQMFLAISTGGIHLKHFDLANRGAAVNDKALELFWVFPGDGRPVPCPELEYFSVFDCEVSALAVARVLLCHPKLTFLGFKRMGILLKVVREEMVKWGMKEFKCLLTHISNTGTKRDVVTMGSR